jgi:DNA polymerase
MSNYLRLVDEGLAPVLHVHDEYVCEVPIEGAKEHLRRIEELVTLSPRWAEGLPVGVEGKLSPCYFK